MKIADLVKDAIKPIFDEEKEIKLVDVEYKKMQDGMHLIVYIDKESGVNIDDCEHISKLVEEVIDDLDPTGDESYRLDISSYGLDKPLKYDWQFKKYQNKPVDVKLYRKLNGLKEFTATLVSFNEEEFVFNIDGENVAIKDSEIANITAHIDF